MDTLMARGRRLRRFGSATLRPVNGFSSGAKVVWLCRRVSSVGEGVRVGVPRVGKAGAVGVIGLRVLVDTGVCVAVGVNWIMRWHPAIRQARMRIPTIAEIDAEWRDQQKDVRMSD